MRQPSFLRRAPFWPTALLLSTALAACGTSVVRVNGDTIGSSSGPSGSASGGTSGGASDNTGGTSTGNVPAGSGPTDGATGGTTSGLATGGVSGTGGGTSGGAGTGTGGNTSNSGGTGTTGGALNQPCSTNNNLDTCVAFGLVCVYSTDPAHTGTVCQLPGEFQPCQVAVGCNNPAMQCLSFSTGSFCFIPCESSSDCTTLYTTCQGGPPGICYLASCQLGEGLDGGFASCDAAGAGDGTCLPNPSQPLCLQGGTAAPGDVCQTQRGANTSSADLCQPNDACIPDGATGAGHCAPLCGLDGGPSCPAPTFCQPSQDGPWGYCL